MIVDTPAVEFGFTYVSQFWGAAKLRRAKIGRMMKVKTNHAVSSDTNGLRSWN